MAYSVTLFKPIADSYAGTSKIYGSLAEALLAAEADLKAAQPVAALRQLTRLSDKRYPFVRVYPTDEAPVAPEA